MITYFQTGAKRASRRAPPLQPKLTDERVQLSLEKIRVNIGDILLCLSRAQSFISPIITRHHQQVAYLSYRLCEQLEFSGEQTKDIFLAALVHDIGALSVEEQLSLIELEPVDVNNRGFRVL
ncbi:metal dependent phosphohydrolase [Thermacetogenium phaeum DSM 12270]|uniref:Metal dependent phosphohydrolase n=1 Tax=Thermacetogenium phaeum (strain ATCC BAA-254 / DSM 26808 / PB) TaxID=1089553 RepID=K4LXF6_THEPS|nr:metal dependent phosphohydrolase [Thermacetogenium phaeum DSM 12270]